jgi:hypothetical protein
MFRHNMSPINATANLLAHHAEENNTYRTLRSAT